MAQPTRPGGFDFARLSTGSKILLGAGILLLIALFLPWQDVGNLLGFDVPGDTINGFRGVGVLVALLVIGLIVWEGLLAAGAGINTGTMSPGLISAILGGAAALFTIIHFLTSLDGVTWGAFVGLILALVLGYGAYMRYTESRTAAPPPPPA
jgi:hypothetical protein